MRQLSFCITALCIVLTLPAAAAADNNAIYAAQTVITGRDNLAERQRGIEETFMEVLAKVSGDISVTDDPALAEEKAAAAEAVEEFVYHDRKAGIQITDEQGTRDRSFDFTVKFVPERINAILARLGREPWEEDRPTLGIDLEVTDGSGTFTVTPTSEKGWGQREVIMALSERTGVPVSLGGSDEAPKLIGRMAITNEGFWDTAWQLITKDNETAWEVKGKTFDEALHNGLWQSTLLLSGKAS